MADRLENSSIPTGSYNTLLQPAKSFAKASSAHTSSVLSRLTAQQKVAAILAGMNREMAAKLLKYFTPEDMRLLSMQAQTLPHINPSDFEKIVAEFEDAFAEGAPLSEAGERFNRLVREALPEKEAALVFERKLPRKNFDKESFFENIEEMSASELQTYIGHENPQVIAYIISKLPSDLAAKMLLEQDNATRPDIIKRTLHLGTILPTSTRLLEDALMPLFLDPTKKEKVSQYGQVASILNQLDKEDIDEMLAKLQDLNPKDYNSIKARLFSFEDIPNLTEKARLLLFDQVPMETLLCALHDVDQDFLNIVLDAFSPRRRRMIETELSLNTQTFSATEVIKARQKIAQLAIQLSQQGQFSLNQKTDSV